MKHPPLLTARQQGLANYPARNLEVPYSARVSAFLLLHIPLAILMRQSPQVATVHALITFTLGMFWAISSRPREQVAYVGAYIAGAEVLWRMTGAEVPWEFGKYAIVAIFLVTMLRVRRLQGPALPFFYFLLLLPATILTLTETSLDVARQLISTNLSGPFALMFSAWFFAPLKFEGQQRQKLFLAALGPILGTSGNVLFGIATARTIVFGSGANETLSGGYGPNQVSAILALGALLAFWYVFDDQPNKVLKMLVFGLIILFLTQSVLTFSRGGLYNAVGSIVLAIIFLIRNRRVLIKILFTFMLFFLLGQYVILPALNEFTHGAIIVRFTDTSRTSGRDAVVKADLQIWQENPFYGVGPGRATFYRALIFRANQAHTEQTRMLAEHGFLGLIALVMLLGMAGQRVKRAPAGRDRAFAASMVGFSLLYMLHAAMRLVTPAFVFGLAYALYLPEQKDQGATTEPPPYPHSKTFGRRHQTHYNLVK